jgi:hypothetical protein
MIKKWNLSGPVLSLISFSINNTIEDPNQQVSKISKFFGGNQSSKYNKSAG